MEMNYPLRLKRLREKMVENNLDAVFLMISSDLQYLTGVLREPHNPTDDDKHGDEIYGAFITLEKGPVFIAPLMGASEFVRSQAEGKPWVEDIHVINDWDDPLTFLKDVLSKIGNPRRIGVSGRLWARSIFLLKQAQPEAEFSDASLFISKMRAVKDEAETKLMKEAGLITDQVFAAVLKQMRIGMTEYDIAREVNHQIIMHGGSWTSFHTNVSIKGKGIRKLYCPDGKTGNTPIQPGAVITFDYGVIYKGYVSDFGRTVFCGEPTAEYRHFHDSVMASQAAAISAMKCGQVTAKQLNEIARKVLDDVNLGQYFTHRLGHGIGSDVHEPPFLYELDETVLTNGMCFTIEPSVRIPGYVDVRVEDVVQVTKDGGVPFSNFSRDILVI